MIPPLVRRCPDCGHLSWSRRFAVVSTADGPQLVECPSCGHRFETVDGPRLN
ncbi:hypothetical protein EGH21_04920 [Halomicroarcula sp. F13]|uniref:Small CPxCG-related zinc finger protein n=1 Tax=Haloarcula rubra TaxID=2487747 RepID=A0AAW4PMM4_9EURY|nr:hypothetical protein [Halomicroarcula rubra]MBX0322371.1 hypothetical protein [Halomicroarcula rubra]